MTLKKSKRILGIFAVLIMFHHMGQMVSAPWVADSVRQPGLEVFVPIGYLLVSFFFFCSGYGLIKSLRTKEYYFVDFFVHRLNRILFVTIVTGFVYFLLRVYKNVVSFPLNPFSWYVFTIAILYVGFFLAYRKEGRASFPVMCAWVLGYSVICYVLGFGNWWINAVPAFLVGIRFADKKEEKKSVVALIVCALIAAACFALTENASAIAAATGFKNYGVLDICVVILQMAGSSAFSAACYYITLLTPAEDAKNKALAVVREVLAFLGGFTLEIYLVHGIFVNVFGPNFIGNKVRPYCYIRSVPLYVLVVCVLSLGAAFGLKVLFDLISENYYRFTVLEKFMHNTKRNLIILGVIVVIGTIYLGIKHNSDSAAARDQLSKYKQSNITMVDAAGEQIAVYTQGEGEYTVVLMSSMEAPGSTLNLRTITSYLGEEYRVVIIDFPGSGFSPDSGAEKTVDHYADIIKGVLDSLGITDKIILMPHSFAGLYAFRYIEKYPDGIAGMICIDAAPPEAGPHLIQGKFKTTEEYEWNIERGVRSDMLWNQLATFTGYVDIEMVYFDLMFTEGIMKDYAPAIKELFIEGNLSESYISELTMIYANSQTMSGFKLPEDIPVMFLLSSDVKYSKAYGINWTKCYERMITNADKQKVVNFTGNSYAVYYYPKLFSSQLTAFMKENSYIAE